MRAAEKEIFFMAHADVKVIKDQKEGRQVSERAKMKLFLSSPFISLKEKFSNEHVEKRK